MYMNKREQHEAMNTIHACEEEIIELKTTIEMKDVEISELEEENAELREKMGGKICKR